MMEKIKTFYSRSLDVLTSRKMTVAILGVFVLQALLLAGIMKPGVPPDESNHINFITYYKENSLSPFFSEQEPTWTLGDKTREVDYLYHYGMSLVARVVPGDSFDLYVIRILSIVIATASFVVLIKIFRRIGIGNGAVNTALVILTNLPMVLMVSAAVNNDTSVWLLTLAGTLLLLRIWKSPTLLDVLLIANVAAFGGLIKRTLLPLGVLFAAAVAIILVRKWGEFKKSIRFNYKITVAGLLLIVGFGLVAERIGGNLYQYQKINPSCASVQGKEACSVFWLSARERWIEKGSPASENTWLPKDAVIEKELRPLPVFSGQWVSVSIANVINIQTQGWRHKVKPWAILTPIAIIGLIVAAILAVYYDRRFDKPGHKTRYRLCVGVVGVFILATFLMVNYGSYQSTGLFGLALNGRYIIPGLMLLVGLSCFYWARLLGERKAPIVAVATALLFVCGSGLIMMLQNTQLVTG